MADAGTRRTVRFSDFEVDLHAAELRKHGKRIKLPPQPFEILALLVDRPGDVVTRDELRAKLWPEDTFVDFDHSVNVAISKVREALGDSADAPRYVETLPRRGYRFIGSLDAVAPSSAALKPEQEAAPPSLASTRRPRALSLALAAALLVVTGAAGVFVWESARPRARVPAGRIMLVVLPFQNLSGDATQDYLSDGLTEEMITQLGRLNPDRLGVIARTSAMKYRNTSSGVDEVGRALGVDYVVEGSLRRADDRVRISAQLIQVSDQTHLWAQNYDRDFRDILALQSDVSQAVAREIQLTLAPRQQASLGRLRPVQPEAYQAYLRARYYDSGAAGLGAERAIENYKKAIEKDPNYALAYAGLARSSIFGVRMRPKVALAAAHEAAKKALELDPASPEAHIAWAMTKLYYELDLTAADKEFRHALEMDPGNADTQFYYAQCLGAMGRFEEAIVAARRAQQLDPFSALIGHYIGRLYYFSRQYEKAIEELQKTLELNPNYAFTHIYLVTANERLHKYDQAVAHRQKYWALIGRRPEDVAELGKRYASSGYRGVLSLVAEGARAFAAKNGYLTSTELTFVYAEMGETDEALRWLEKAVDDQTRDLIYVKIEPSFDPLRSNPRFADLLRRIGLER